MNKEVESNFDDILYDQDIGVEIRIEIPKINYEEAIEMPKFKLEIPVLFISLQRTELTLYSC